MSNKTDMPDISHPSWCVFHFVSYPPCVNNKMISHSKMSDTNTIVLGEKLLAKHWWGKLNADILDKIDKRKSLLQHAVPIKKVPSLAKPKAFKMVTG